MKKQLGLILMTGFLITRAASQIVAPTPYSTDAKVNYTRTWEAVKPYLSEADVTNSSRTTQEVRQVTQYFDGLGRPLQTVLKKSSLATGDTARDLVTPVVYDKFGRVEYSYLPFAANSTGSNSSISDGKFKLNPFQQDSAFNKGMFGDESYYYSRTVFEASPLNRSLENYSPGNNWVGTAGQSSESNRRGIKSKTWVNTSSDSVTIWNVTEVSNGFATYSTSGRYAAGLLLKNITLDENNKQVIEFKDKEGSIILKKVQLGASSDTGIGKGHSGWLCTYYIYDFKKQLRAVIQPVGVDLLLTGDWSMTSTILDEQCFRYEYDGRGRITQKKVPGAGTAIMIYDSRDRLVLTQDSLLRTAHKWMYNLYDELNRPVATGTITDNSNYNNPLYHRTQAATSTSYPNVGSYINDELTRTFYDDYSWRSAEGNPLSATRNNSYDSYLLSSSNTVFPYAQDATVQSSRLRGKLTGTKKRILSTSTFLYSVIFYDDRGQVIQIQSTNHTGGTDIATTQFSWTGQPLITINKQEKVGTNSQTTLAVTKISYDDLFRVLKTEKKISHTKVNSGTMPSSWTTISEMEYDALGQTKKKKLGGASLETLNYEYNIRGWMLGMNRSYVKDTTSTANWFGFDLGYDKTSFTVNGTSQSYATAQYNGNINGMMWRSTGDDYLRKYDFTYDAANRFLSADFNQLNSNSFSKTIGLNFSTTGMSYDANGNILTMNQKGWKLGGSVTIDSLLYGYNTSSNRLSYVHDRKNDSTTLLGDFKEYTNNSSQDYTYDGNGNMTSDANKKITGISYNYLNIPTEITITSPSLETGASRNISYTYDATGNKLKKITSEYMGLDAHTIHTTVYLNGIVFESDEQSLEPAKNYTDKLMFINTEEGRARIKNDSSAIVYDFFIKDHLGNVRMVLTNENQTDAYPAASMETAQATIENTYYAQIEQTRYAKSNISGYPSDTYTSPNDYVAKLNGNGASGNYKMGPSIVLKVMAGDTINIFAKSYWKPNTGNLDPVSNNGMLTDLVAAMAGAFAGVSNGHYQSGDLTGGVLNSGASSILSQNASVFLADQGSVGDNRPKAFLNWIMFDEQFNYMASSSGYDFVAVGNTLKTHTINNLTMKKNGYLFVYVSNESQLNVYFDNLQVTHYRGRLLEESHYYPFGLTMTGLSSKALVFGGVENKKNYQQYECNPDFNLNLYESFYRTHDPQLGRFLQIDPKPIYVMEGLYNSMSNNPVSNVDILGDVTYYYNTDGKLLRSQNDGKKKATITVVSEDNLKVFFAAGAIIDLINAYSKGKNGTSAYTGAEVAGFLSQTGVSYDTKEYENYYDKHSKDYYKGDIYKPIDGKGKLINEHMAGLTLKDKYLRVMDKRGHEDDRFNDPIASMTSEIGNVSSDVHTHSSEGRRISISGRDATVQSGKNGLGDASSGDLSRGTWETAGQEKYRRGIFDVVVSPTHIYLYRNGVVTISIDRNGVPSKNPGEIK